jgi:PAS domain S-box-containing protein
VLSLSQNPTKNLDQGDLKFLVKSLPIPVIIFNHKLHLIAASKRFYTESPINEEDTGGNPHWYDLVPDMPEKWKLIHQRCLKGEHLKSDADPFYRADSSVEWWRWEITPWLDDQKNVMGIILYVENITKQKLLESNLKKTIDYLSQSNHELSKFARVCAHDLNEPLRTITNYIQLIEEEYSKELDETLKKYFDVIIETSKNMNDLIRNILNYSEAKIRKIKPKAIRPIKVIENILINLDALIRSKRAVINYADSMPKIYADRVLITEVLQNLIINSLKYNDKAYPIIHIRLKELESYWIFSIKDNGIGIEKSSLKNIFKESVRLSLKPIKGSGMGLYQSYKIIKDHGGKIWAKSTLGMSSTFFFTLPKPSIKGPKGLWLKASPKNIETVDK